MPGRAEDLEEHRPGADVASTRRPSPPSRRSRRRRQAPSPRSRWNGAGSTRTRPPVRGPSGRRPRRRRCRAPNARARPGSRGVATGTFPRSRPRRSSRPARGPWPAKASPRTPPAGKREGRQPSPRAPGRAAGIRTPRPALTPARRASPGGSRRRSDPVARPVAAPAITSRKTPSRAGSMRWSAGRTTMTSSAVTLDRRRRERDRRSRVPGLRLDDHGRPPGPALRTRWRVCGRGHHDTCPRRPARRPGAGRPSAGAASHR